MTVHNYRSRQVHETLNGVNPSSGFRDMRSAKSGSNLWQIWQVFGPWASPYGANGQMSMTVHNYRPRQFHRTWNGENPSSGYRDMGSASLAAARPTARPPGPWRQYPSSPEGWGVKRLKSNWNLTGANGLTSLSLVMYHTYISQLNNQLVLVMVCSLCDAKPLTHSGFHTKGRLLVKSNLICPSDKLSWQPGCPILNINIQGNFCISQGNCSSGNLPENLV